MDINFDKCKCLDMDLSLFRVKYKISRTRTIEDEHGQLMQNIDKF